MLIMNLTELGLSKNEERVFRTLIAHGRLSANMVSRYSNVSYGKIYEVLASLEYKGLVRVVPEKTKIFVPVNPAVLIELIEQKKSDLDTLRKEVEDLKKVYTDNPEDAVVIVRGKHNFPKVLKSMKSPKTFSYAAKYDFVYSAESLRKYKARVKRGVEHKIMGRVAPDSIENIKHWQKAGQTIKQLDFDNVALGIDDKQVLLVLVKKNISMLIRDDSFIKLMKEFYDYTYEKKKEVQL